MTITSRVVLALGGVATVAASVLALGTRERAQPLEAPVDQLATTDGRVVGPGRVEPISEEIQIGVEVGGRLVAIGVEEGDRVHTGQVLATLESRDYVARVALAEARLADARAARLRADNGSRPEERLEAGADVAQAEAAMAQAEREARRRDQLAREGVIAREEQDRSARDLDVARARLDQVRQRRALVDAGPRAEDRARAAAEVDAAQAALHEARARLAKTSIVSPIDGTVLRRRVRVGESVSPEVPDSSLFTVADVSRLRVRVDVDEHDVGAIRVGQRAYVTAVAYGARRFEGRVVRIGQVLGRKNIRTDEPRERVDTKILETLVELEAGAALPIGLRVDATILTSR